MRRGSKTLARLDDGEFREEFSGSPIKRIGRGRFVRNVLVAIGNSGAPELAAEAERLIDDAEPQVRGAAIWALQRLAPERVPLLAAERLAKETHPDVPQRMAGRTPRSLA